MADLIIWNTFSYGGEDSITLPLFPVPKVALRPSGAHQIANWLSQFGYDVKVIDFCHLMSTSDLVSITEKHITPKTRGVGCNSTFWKNYCEGPHEDPSWVINARTSIENKYPHLEWLLGGAAAFKGRYHKLKWTMFYSYSEEKLLKYLDETSTGKFDIRTLARHYGLGCNIQPYEVLPIQLSRGCQFDCKFCNAPMRNKAPDSNIRDPSFIKDELIFNYENFGTTRYYLIDDTMNESDTKLESLARIVSELPFKFEWLGYNRLDLIGHRPHQIQLLKATGLRSAFFGVETFNKKSAAVIGKGWNATKGKDFLLRLREEWKSDINWTLSFVIGLPYDNRASIEETQKWCIDNKMPSWHFNALFLDPRKANPDMSTFEKESRKHGYEFYDHTLPNTWSNDIWNSFECIDFMWELSREKQQYQGLASWILGECATSLEVPFDDIINKPFNSIDDETLRSNTDRQVSDYVKAQLSN